MGIGLENKLKKNHFKIDSAPENYGCFINTSTQKIYLVGKDGKN